MKLIISGILASVLVLGGCGKASSSVPTTPTANAPSTAPSTSVAAGAIPFTEKDLGFPFYPGSTPIEHGSTTLTTDGRETHSYSATSTDDLGKIADFYRPLAADAKELGKPDTGLVIFAGKLADGRAFQITLSDQKKTGTRMVHILSTGK